MAFQQLSCHTPLIYCAEGGLPIGQCGIDLPKGSMNDEWESPVLEYRNTYTVDIPDEDAVSDAPDLKSAEPKCS